MSVVTKLHPEPLPAVYAAIAAVMEDVGKDGIAKDRRNEQQKYQFRGIDDVYNALAPILAKHRLVIVPRVLSREKTERQTERGGTLFSVVVHVEFDIICATDGSRHVASTWGEAMDSGDKATNKAMSAAYKYMAMQTFCIPTEGDNDADGSTPGAIVPEKKATQPPDPTSAPTMSKGDARADFAALQYEIRNCRSLEELKAWGAQNARRVETQPTDWKKQLRAEYSDMLDGFKRAKESAEAADRDFEEMPV